MTLTDYQWSYNNLTFGDGTVYYVDHAEGFEGYEVRQADSDQPRNDGAIRGLDYVGARTVALTLALGETADTDYEARWSTLVFKRPGQPERYINCRPVQLTRVEEYLT